MRTRCFAGCKKPRIVSWAYSFMFSNQQKCTVTLLRTYSPWNKESVISQQFWKANKRFEHALQIGMLVLYTYISMCSPLPLNKYARIVHSKCEPAYSRVIVECTYLNFRFSVKIWGVIGYYTTSAIFKNSKNLFQIMVFTQQKICHWYSSCSYSL